MADRQASMADPDVVYKTLKDSVAGTPLRDIFISILEHLCLVRKSGKSGYICWDMIDRFIKLTAMQNAATCSDPISGISIFSAYLYS